MLIRRALIPSVLSVASGSIFDDPIGTITSGEQDPITIFEKGIRLMKGDCLVFFGDIETSSALDGVKQLPSEPCIKEDQHDPSSIPALFMNGLEVTVSQAVPSNVIRGYRGVVCRVVHIDGEKASRLAGVYARKGSTAYEASVALNICRELVHMRDQFHSRLKGAKSVALHKRAPVSHPVPSSTGCFGSASSLAVDVEGSITLTTFSDGMEIGQEGNLVCIYTPPDKRDMWRSVMSSKNFVQYYSQVLNRGELSLSGTSGGSRAVTLADMVTSGTGAKDIQAVRDTGGDPNKLMCKSSGSSAHIEDTHSLDAGSVFGSYITHASNPIQQDLTICKYIRNLAKAAEVIVYKSNRVIKMSGGISAPIKLFMTSDIADLILFEDSFYLFPQNGELMTQVYLNPEQYKSMASGRFKIGTFVDVQLGVDRKTCDNPAERNRFAIRREGKKVYCSIPQPFKPLGMVFGSRQLDGEDEEINNCWICEGIEAILHVVDNPPSATSISERKK